jgi:hypothetical protein
MIRRLSEAKRTLATQPPGVTLQDPGLLFFGWQPVIFWTCELPHTGNQLTSVSYRSASNGLSASRADAQAHGPVRDMEDGNMKTLITAGVAALTIALVSVFTQPAFAEAPNSVIVGGQNIGADPDANVRLQMRRDFGSEGF